MTFRTDQFSAALDTALKETGLQLQKSAHEVATYAALRSVHLAGAVGQKGFQEAVVAERDAVALYAGIQLVAAADAADDITLSRARNRLVGLIHGALAMAVSAAPLP
jgi:hypothetical protein